MLELSTLDLGKAQDHGTWQPTNHLPGICNMFWKHLFITLTLTMAWVGIQVYCGLKTQVLTCISKTRSSGFRGWVRFEDDVPGRGDDIHMDDEPIQHVDGIHVDPIGLWKILNSWSTFGIT